MKELLKQRQIGIAKDNDVELYIKQSIVLLEYGFVFNTKTHTPIDMDLDTLEDILYDIKGGALIDADIFYDDYFNSVMQMDKEELQLNAIIHYITGVIPKKIGDVIIEPLKHDLELDSIDVVQKDAVAAITASLMEQQYTYSSDEEKLVCECIEFCIKNDLDLVFNKDIKNCDNRIFLYSKYNDFLDLKNVFQTPTDVLKYAFAISGKDHTLKTSTRPGNIKRKYRHEIMKHINNFKHYNEHYSYNKKMFKILASVVHPFERKFSKYNEAVLGFKACVNDNTSQTMSSKRNSMSGIELLESYSASHNALLRDFSKVAGRFNVSDNIVADYVKTACENADINVLVSFVNYTNSQTILRGYDERVVYDKTGKMVIVKNKQIKAKPSTILKANNVASKILTYRYNDIVEAGLIVECEDDKITPMLKLSSKHSSGGYTIMPRYSRIDISDMEMLRMFLYWVGDDVDLSAMVIKRDGSYETCDYTDLNPNGAMVHSGDITYAPNGASEYIDIDFNKLDDDIECIVVDAISYTGHTFDNIQDCFVGFMDRNKTGKVYEPSTVKTKLQLSSHTTNMILFIVDVINKNIIWVDSPTEVVASGVSIGGTYEAKKAIIDHFTIRTHLDANSNSIKQQ